MNNNSNNINISPRTVERLMRYYSFLGELIDEGKPKISSKEFSERMKLTASQIRQDLNCFGGFGVQGYGYNVELLRNEIAEIIGITKMSRVIIVGAGNLGQAICDDVSFGKRGCELIGIFDNDPQLIGKEVAGRGGNTYKISSMEELPAFCAEEKPQIAVLCVPKTSAKEVCTQLCEAGVRNFWNFTHFDINLHFEDVVVENVHLGDSLLTLLYNINKSSDNTEN
jgi:redox-sensing transcriptional repressor